MRDLLRGRFGCGPVRLETLALSDITDFVTARAEHLAPRSVQTVVTAMRSFLRYLQLCGFATANWVGGVPRVAHWRLAAIPDALSDRQLRDLLAAFDHTAASGRRDYAIAICFARRALRACEVSRITLDDIDWRSRVLILSSGKGRHADHLPLPSHVHVPAPRTLESGRWDHEQLTHSQLAPSCSYWQPLSQSISESRSSAPPSPVHCPPVTSPAPFSTRSQRPSSCSIL